MHLIGINDNQTAHKTFRAILIGFNDVKMMELTTETMLDKVLMIEDILTEKQLLVLQDMLYVYKDLQEVVHNYPEPDTLFTQTQRDLFNLFDIK